MAKRIAAQIPVTINPVISQPITIRRFAFRFIGFTLPNAALV
jgi:hypothetical protein